MVASPGDSSYYSHMETLRASFKPFCRNGDRLSCKFIALTLTGLSIESKAAWALAHDVCNVYGSSAEGMVLLEDFLLYLCDGPPSERRIRETVLQATSQGDEEKVVRFLRRHTIKTLELCDDEGNSLLHLATRGGNLKILKFLVEQTADLEVRNKKGFSAAMLAAWRGQRNCLRLLAESKADLDARDGRNSTGAGLAARTGRYFCLQFLTEQGVDLTVVTKDGSTVLALGALGGHSLCLTHLIKCGVDMERTNNAGRTPLLLAARAGHLGCVRALLLHGAKLAACDRHGCTVAIAAAKGGHTDILSLLFQARADLEAKSSEACSSVAMLYLLGQERFLLLPSSVNANLRISDDVRYLTGSGKLRRMSTSEIDPSTFDDDSIEVLEAAEQGNLQKLQALANRHANFHGRSGSGSTPTILAARSGHEACVHMLVMHKASLHDKQEKGKTAAIVAAQSGQTSCLRVLISLRADLEAEDRLGHTALISCSRSGHLESLQFLIAVRANIEENRHEGHTALLDAAGSGHKSCLDHLIACGARLRARTNAGNTALSLAAKGGHAECAELLVRHGADLLEKDGTGLDPIKLLRAKHCSKLLDVLLPHLDWISIVDKGILALGEVLFPSCSTADGPPNLSHASLYDNIWKSPGELHNKQLVDGLGDIVRVLLRNAGEQHFGPYEQKLLGCLLNLGVLATDGKRDATELAVTDAMDMLQGACDERQKALGSIASCTEQVSTIYTHMTRFGCEDQSQLDQRDAMPEHLWKWVESHFRDSFDTIYAVFEAFRYAGAVQAPSDFCKLLRQQNVISEVHLFATGVADLLIAYAELVNPSFVLFMQGLFGDAFTSAPIKRKARMLEKVTLDLQKRYPDFTGFSDESVASNVPIRTSLFELGDVVRGSVVVDGADAMLAVKKQLEEFVAKDDGINFQVWRVKNSHHPEAETVGGYRDMKVLGRFTAPAPTAFMAPLSMIVEVQILDQQFLNIKKYMHKVYAVKRGDFWTH